MIPFNIPIHLGLEEKMVIDAIKSGRISGNYKYSKFCQNWFENNLNCLKSLLTSSCTHALEMSALLIDIEPGDEVIMPSYTFVSTANAFVLRGAKIVFIDIRPDTMNINEMLIEEAISSRTKAIVPVHYAGVPCEMDVIYEIAQRYNLYVIEDAAQGMMSFYRGKPVGTLGHLATYSFHETKNFTSGGEGGLLIINNEKFVERAEIIREKGTNRSQFIRGMLDKYTWVDIGSSYLPSELQAAYLYGQLEKAVHITNNRKDTWNKYQNAFSSLVSSGIIEIPIIPKTCEHNGHMFYLKVKNLTERTLILEHLKKNGIMAVFHYVPLHSSPAGMKFGRFQGKDEYTTSESMRLLRLPLWYGMKEEIIQHVIKCVKTFFN